jgi:hypothetical protein
VRSSLASLWHECGTLLDLGTTPSAVDLLFTNWRQCGRWRSMLQASRPAGVASGRVGSVWLLHFATAQPPDPATGMQAVRSRSRIDSVSAPVLV